MYGFGSLDKRDVLMHLDQEEAFEYYLGIPVIFNKLFRSPLRKDKNPTCTFKYSRKGELYLRDFSGHFWGNIFDLVMRIEGIEFGSAVVAVALDFGIIDADDKTLRERRELHKDGAYLKNAKFGADETTIEIRAREFNTYDKMYWMQFGINRKILRIFSVFPVEYVWVNGSRSYVYSHKDLAYAYRNGRGRYKIYFPGRKIDRFLSNPRAFDGYKQLPETGEVVVVTKSRKDVMVLYAMGIPAICPQSEVKEIPPKLAKELKSRFKYVVTNYDFDRGGCHNAWLMRKDYGFIPLMLTRGRYGSEDFGAKDVSDYRKLYGRTGLIQLIEEARRYAKVISGSSDPTAHNACTPF